MPAIFVEAGPMDRGQKALLEQRLTADVSEVLGVAPESVMVFLRENLPENISVGGISVAELKKRSEK